MASTAPLVEQSALDRLVCQFLDAKVRALAAEESARRRGASPLLLGGSRPLDSRLPASLRQAQRCPERRAPGCAHCLPLQASDPCAELARNACAAVAAGRPERVLELLRSGGERAQALLQDDRLLFKLRRQHFLELAQSGEPGAARQAIGTAAARSRF